MKTGWDRHSTKGVVSVGQHLAWVESLIAPTVCGLMSTILHQRQVAVASDCRMTRQAEFSLGVRY